MKPILLLTAIFFAACGTPSPSSQCRGYNSTCVSTLDCCARLACENNLCVTPSSPTTCSAVGQSCNTISDCCAGSSCPRFGTVCALGSIGDPCSTNADCHTNLTCSGRWCSKPCVSNADCGATSYCLAQQSGGYECFPFCQSNADCAVYGAGVGCSTGTSPTGLTLPACSG